METTPPDPKQSAKEAKQFRAVVAARDDHNKTCPLGPALECHMHPFDIERMLWEDGDTIAGLRLCSNHRVPLDRLWIRCKGDIEAGDPDEVIPLEQPDTVTIPDYIPEPEKIPGELEPAFARGAHDGHAH